VQHLLLEKCLVTLVLKEHGQSITQLSHQLKYSNTVKSEETKSITYVTEVVNQQELNKFLSNKMERKLLLFCKNIKVLQCFFDNSNKLVCTKKLLVGF
jgi:hypothetical protein